MRRRVGRFRLSRLAFPAIAVACVLLGMRWMGVGGDVLRVGGGLALILFLPGGAVVAAFWPGSAADVASDGDPSTRELNRVGRWTASVGLSLAVSVLGAFLLNFVPEGLTARNWLILLGGAAMAAELIAAIRYHMARRRYDAPRIGGIRAWRWPRPSQVTVALGAVVIAGAGLWLSQSSAAGVSQPSFTQLWLVPHETGAHDTASAGTAQLGVRDDEDGETRYRLVLRHGGAPVRSWTFALERGDVWQRAVTLPPDGQLAARLYRDGSGVAYRKVQLQAQSSVTGGS